MIREGFFSPDPSADRGRFLGGFPLISLSKRHTTLGSVPYRLSRRRTFPSPPWQPTATRSLGLWNPGRAGPVGASLRRPCHLKSLIQTSGGSKHTGHTNGERTAVNGQTNKNVDVFSAASAVQSLPLSLPLFCLLTFVLKTLVNFIAF